MTLLERWDQYDFRGINIKNEEIRRAIAIAQAVDDMRNGKMPGCCDSVIHLQIMEHAEELLRGES